jgi:ABC-type Fe2+-enterobactin transport system substrate-binding protein
MAGPLDEPRDKNGEWSGGGESASRKGGRSFSDQQHIELKDYAEGNYKNLNGYLHNTDSVRKDRPQLAAAYDKQIAHIDAALAKSKLSKDIVVYRGIQSEYALTNADKLVGRTVNADGFQSTSLNRNVAENFASQGRGSLVLEITARKGTNAINMEPFKTNGNSGEQEILFGHGKQIKVTGVDRSRRILVIKGEFV